HFGGQAQQAQGVGDRRAVLADALSQRVLRVAVLFDQAIHRLGKLDRIEILALDVLDQRQLEGLSSRDVAPHHQHLLQVGALRGSPAISSKSSLPGRRRTTSGSSKPCSRKEEASSSSFSESKC